MHPWTVTANDRGITKNEQRANCWKSRESARHAINQARCEQLLSPLLCKLCRIFSIISELFTIGYTTESTVRERKLAVSHSYSYFIHRVTITILPKQSSDKRFKCVIYCQSLCKWITQVLIKLAIYSLFTLREHRPLFRSSIWCYCVYSQWNVGSVEKSEVTTGRII